MDRDFGDRSADPGYPAYRCRICHEHPNYRLDRRGDAVVSWACAAHLVEVVGLLQRRWELTELVVTRVAAPQVRI